MSGMSGVPTAAVAIITDPEEQVLIVRRRSDARDPWSGHWALPGGRLQAGESPLQACRREVTEEVGIELPSESRLRLADTWAGNAVGTPVLVAVYCFLLPRRPVRIHLDKRELAAHHWLPARHFDHHHKHQRAALATACPDRRYPFIQVLDSPLWGFTYQMLQDYHQRGGGRRIGFVQENSRFRAS
jgi:8-oxo-dGTP pyrophosphatase MutT (NUDIX family)